MNTHPNDPKLTAYVLGELTEDERKIIELEMESSESLRKEIQGLKEVSMWLKEKLTAELNEEKQVLDEKRKQEVFKTMLVKNESPTHFPWGRFIQFGVAASILLVMASVFTPSWMTNRKNAQLAKHYEVFPVQESMKALVSDDRAARQDVDKAAGENRLSQSTTSEPTSEEDSSIPLGAPVPSELGQKKDNESTRNLEQPAFNAPLDTPKEGARGAGTPLKEAEILSDSLGIAKEEQGVFPSSVLIEAKKAHDAKPAAIATRGKGEGVAGLSGEQVPQALLKRKVIREEERFVGYEPPQTVMPAPSTPAVQMADFNTEAYDQIQDNPFLAVSNNALSTFSIDVDTASYANLRRFLTSGQLPPKDAVRIEEMINYFSYDYPKPSDEEPFSVSLQAASCPWAPQHQLVRIGLKGREMEFSKRPACNLVFLIDVSGSMQDENKLPLLKKSMKLLVESLNEKDRVAIVVYAGSEGLVLPSTPCNNKQAILQALENLQAGGSTNGEAGIRLAYGIAESQKIAEGNNRVILATDGDFNVGVTNQGDLLRLLEQKASSGIFLSVLGFGMGNYKDSTLEKLADKGNGNYAYIDTLEEGKKVLVEQGAGTLFTIAKDVKIQVEFNPSRIEAYRLIGYENRILKAEDFNNDKKDAGEIGSGHTVTALYEIVPKGVNVDLPKVDALKYQPVQKQEGSASIEMLTVKLRYKKPDADLSQLKEFPLLNQDNSFEKTPEDFKFTCAVAAFGMILRDSPHKGSSTLDLAFDLARLGLGKDENGYRTEFLGLIQKAKKIQR